jgi:predicted nucleic acid-binding protein
MGESVRALLDTSVVIASGIEPLDGELAISSITLAEMHFGVLVAKERSVRAERLRRLLLLQRTFDALPIDDAVATSYGRRRSRCWPSAEGAINGPAHRRDRTCALSPALHP